MNGAGIVVRFTTDATSIAINVSRPQGGVDIDDIFAANGRSGFDVYAQDPALGAAEWRWAATETSTCTRQKGSIVLPVPPGEVCENAFCLYKIIFNASLYKNYRFAKTGSGQTWGKG